MKTSPERFLLCRPEGGLNDLLCQIGKCERALVLSGGKALDVEYFPLEPDMDREVAHPASTSSLPAGTMDEVLEQLEVNMIVDALQRAQGNKAKAAALLDISERSLWYKLKKYHIDNK